MKDLFVYLAGVLGKRFTIKQKSRFLAFAVNYFKKEGYCCKLDIKKGPFGRKVRNLLVGNLKEAEIVFVVPYDTPSKILIPGYQYYPINRKKNIREEYFSRTVALLLTFVVYALYFAAVPFGIWDLGGCVPVLSTAILFLITWAVVKLMIGVGNRFNYTRNTSALVLCFSIAARCTRKKNKRAFAFTDMSSSSYEGYDMLRAYLGEQGEKQKFVFLDGIGNEKEIFITHGRAGNQAAELFLKLGLDRGLTVKDNELEPLKADDTLLHYFPGGIYLIGGRRKGEEIVIPHTRSRRDSSFDLDLLERIEEIFLEYC